MEGKQRKIPLTKKRGSRLSPQTIRHNLGMARTFFERIIDWDYPDAPRRVPILARDLPQADEPTPKFLHDPTAPKFLAALATGAARVNIGTAALDWAPLHRARRQTPMVSAERTSRTTIRRVGLEGRDDVEPDAREEATV